MKSKFLDAVGLSAAFLCLIHCLVFPLLLMLPIAIVHNPYIDLVFLVIGFAVVFKLSGTIHSFWLKSLFWVSIILIAVSVAAELIFDKHIDLIYLGAAGLITGHIINFKNHKH